MGEERLSGRGALVDMRSDEQIAKDDRDMGREDGARAGTLDQIGHEMVGKHVQTDEYNEAYDSETSP
jgi:hypothetical protein